MTLGNDDIPSRDRPLSEECPKCGSVDGWYRAAKIDQADLLRYRLIGGPKVRVIDSISGGHCLSCNHEEEAVYEDKASS